VKDGVDTKYASVFSNVEKRMYEFLQRRGYRAPVPKYVNEESGKD
jgi:hypothetical protein